MDDNTLMNQLLKLTKIKDKSQLDKLVADVRPHLNSDSPHCSPKVDDARCLDSRPAIPQLLNEETLIQDNADNPFKEQFAFFLACLIQDGMESCVSQEVEHSHSIDIQHIIKTYRIMSTSDSKFNCGVHKYVEQKFSDNGFLNEMFRKSVDLSKKLRAKGNDFFGNKLYDDALKHYNDALSELSRICSFCRYSPSKCSYVELKRETSLILGNRSMVSFETGDYYSSLHDIEAALNIYGYPMELKHKLMMRKIKCILRLKRFRKAIKSSSKRQMFKEDILQLIRECEALVESNGKMEINRRGTVLTELKDLSYDVNKFDSESVIIDCTLMKNPHKDYNPFLNENIDDVENSRFPTLKDELRVIYDKDLGRHVIANSSIRAGQVLVVEEAISSHLVPHLRQHCCNNCLKPFGNIGAKLPSLLIRDVHFCCFSCYEQADTTYHQFESHFDLAELLYPYPLSQQSIEEAKTAGMSGSIFLIYRLICQKPLQFFVENEMQLFSKYDVKFDFGSFQRNNLESGEKKILEAFGDEEVYKGLFNMVNHENERSSIDKLSNLVKTVFLLYCLMQAGYFGKDGKTSPPKDLNKEHLLIGRLILHFLRCIQFNLHTVYQMEKKSSAATQKVKVLDIGAGVYSTTVLFNHSCAPNTVRVNRGSQTIFIAKRNIKRGEQVSDCYGVHHLSIDKSRRLSSLKKSYMFDCACDACRFDLPLLHDIPSTSLPVKASLQLANTLSRYKKYFESGKFELALEMSTEYFAQLEELRVKYPHRNHEIASIALVSSVWNMAGSSVCR